jgi:hypothetical protein
MVTWTGTWGVRGRSFPLLLLFVLAAALPLAAQTATSSLVGTVSDDTGGVLPGVQVVATSVEAGFHFEATSRQDGSYTITGLRPGAYRLEAALSGFKGQALTTRVPVAQAITVDFKLSVSSLSETVEVTAVAAPVQVKTSEVGFNVTPEEIKYLPQNNRNFLNFAALAPGIRLSDDETRKEISAGAGAARNVNVFIDGASYKNDVLEGGVVGQDASRGNPFPQNAVQEFRVVTQNFKAEYQKASTAIITAVTRSGGNEFHGDFFTEYQDKSLVSNDPFAEERGEDKPDYTRWQMGGNLSGPIVRDKAHFFASYEGNLQDRDQRVTVGNPVFAPLFSQYEGLFPSAFRSHLFFGKLSYQMAPDQFLEVSSNVRHETDIRGFGVRDSYEAAENVAQDVSSVIAKHRLTRSSFANEATVSMVRSRWKPQPLNPTLIGLNFEGLIRIGGRDTTQDFLQRRISLRNDLSLLALDWHGSHLVKVGANLDFLKYDVSKQFNGNPLFTFRGDIGGFDFPAEARFGVGNPDLSADNKQFGIYAQDDWNLTPRLQLNLGLRWDFETDMANNDYVTPAEVRNAFSPFFSSNYFSDGSDRPPFYGAVQPRVGFSYDLAGDGRTVVFAGWGKYYDRTVYNHALDERFRLQYKVLLFRFSADGAPRDGQSTIAWRDEYLSVAGLNQLIASGTAGRPEVFLIENDTRPPHTNQLSVGVRRLLGAVSTSASFTMSRGYNDLSFIFGNRRPDGNCCQELSPLFSNVLLSTDDKRSWYKALFLTLEKPFTSAARWGASISYTLSKAEQNGGDLFSLDFPTVDDYPRYPTATDERHRVVASGILGLPKGFRASTLITYGSGLPFNIDDQSRGSGPNERRNLRNGGNADAFNTIDLRLDKEFSIGRQKVGLTAAGFNIFDHANYKDYNGFIPTLPRVNPDFGKPANVIDTGRRLQFGVNYSF